MKRIKIIFSLFCFVLSACSYMKNVHLLTQGEIQKENYVQVIPFEMRKDIIVINARLNADAIEHEFIFDTGAFNSKVESNLSDALQLEVITEKTNSTAQGISQKIEVVKIDSIQLGETKIYSVGAGKLSYGKTSASPCIAAHGIIGANIIKLANWKIDYEKKLLYFSDQAFEVEKNSLILPFERPTLSATPKIDLAIEGKEVENILFDVGYNGGLVLPLSFADQFEEGPSKIILDQSISGIYGTNRDSLVVKNLKVSLGGVETQIPVEFSALNKALLGNAFLKHFLVVIDNDDNKIYLKRTKPVQIEAPPSFSVGIENDSFWRVSRTSPGLGLGLGDILRFVNGKKPKDLFVSHCDYVMNLHKLFDTEQLLVQKKDGSQLYINPK